MLVALEKINKINGQGFDQYDISKIDNNTTLIETTLNKMQQQSKTYIELDNMVANNQLIAGCQYLLSDYATKYKQPTTDTIKEMSIERLVLTANSTNTFEKICSSLDYPQDVVYYDFSNNKCEDGTTSRNGFILRRIDTTPSVAIDCPNDWRKILWARYLPNPTQYLIGTTLTDYSVWESGNAHLDVVYKVGNTLYMAKNTNIPIDNTDTNVFYSIYNNITVGLLSTDLKVGIANTEDIKLQKSTSYLEYLTFGSNCSRIKISMGTASGILHNNIFGNTCSNNIFGNNCSNNTFGSACSNNIFGNNCSNNIFSSTCSNNTFSSSCGLNIFSSGCGYNIFGNNCSNNIFGNSCSDNTLSTNCSNNIFGNLKKYLNIKYMKLKNISSITLLESRDYTTTIEKRNDLVTVYWSLDSNNVPTYSIIP